MAHQRPHKGDRTTHLAQHANAKQKLWHSSRSGAKQTGGISVIDVIIIVPIIAGVVGLVLLGGEFWDKLRALFLYDAKAHLPS